MNFIPKALKIDVYILCMMYFLCIMYLKQPIPAKQIQFNVCFRVETNCWLNVLWECACRKASWWVCQNVEIKINSLLGKQENIFSHSIFFFFVRFWMALDWYCCHNTMSSAWVNAAAHKRGSPVVYCNVDSPSVVSPSLSLPSIHKLQKEFLAHSNSFYLYIYKNKDSHGVIVDDLHDFSHGDVHRDAVSYCCYRC